MLTKASTIVMSHLSDIQEATNFGTYGLTEFGGTSIKERANFAKWIIIKTKGDLTQEFDADELYTEYLNR